MIHSNEFRSPFKSFLSDISSVIRTLNLITTDFFELFFFSFQIAKSSLDNSLLKYSAKEYMFRAALCHLCVDILNAQHAVEKYCGLYPAFADTRECKLIKVSHTSATSTLRHLCVISCTLSTPSRRTAPCTNVAPIITWSDTNAEKNI